MRPGLEEEDAAAAVGEAVAPRRAAPDESCPLHPTKARLMAAIAVSRWSGNLEGEFRLASICARIWRSVRRREASISRRSPPPRFGVTLRFMTGCGGRQVRLLSAVILLAAVAGCTGSGRGQATGRPSATASPPASSLPTTTSAGAGRDGVVKSPPTVRLAKTDEFGLVVKAERRDGAVVVVVDRVDSFSGVEGERAAAARGVDYANDHFEVNDSPRTRSYLLADDVRIWQANPSDGASPKPLTIAEWMAYLHTDQGRRAMFHLDVTDGRVVGVEEQYFP